MENYILSILVIDIPDDRKRQKVIITDMLKFYSKEFETQPNCNKTPAKHRDIFRSPTEP